MENYVKDKLNPIFFDHENKLKEFIAEKLLLIARKAFEDLEINAEIKDITFTGSLANYTYNKDSDVDLHIILNFNDINKDNELVKKALDCNKFVWNLRHEITFAGHEVEIYFQDEKETHSSSGVYSLLKNKWIVEPKKIEGNVNDILVNKKVANYKNHINSLKKEIDKEITKDYADKILSNAKRLMTKLKAERKEDLEKVGELSLHNLVFKQLRREGFIDKLAEITHSAYDKSLAESYLNQIASKIKLKTHTPSFIKRQRAQKKELKKMFKMTPGTKKRHQHSVGRAGLDRKNPQFVPDMHKANLNSFQKLDNLRNGKKGRFVLSPSEFSKLKKLYNISLVKPGEVKRLGNTGINLYYDQEFNKFVMERL